MIKKILIIFIILVFLAAGGLIYLNSYFMPVRIKSVIIDGLRGQTGKEVTLGALSFSIFKGLVLKDLAIVDKEAQILKVKEASCGFLILPILKRAVIIPTLNIKSADIFLQRRKDGSFNIQELFVEKPAAAKKSAFNIFARKLSIRDSAIRFQDDTFQPPFSRNMEDIDLNLYLSLPDKIKFNFDAGSAGDPKLKLKASGEYGIAKKELSAKVYLRDLSPKEFAPYYRDSGISIPNGRIDGSMEIKYNTETKQLSYSGKATLINLSARGIKFADGINDINAEVTFNNSGLSAQNLGAKLFAVPVRANLNLIDFGNPLINVEISTALDLSLLRNIVRDKFKLDIAVEAEGEARLYLNLQGRLRSPEPPQLNGYLEVSGATLKLQKLPDPIKDIAGRVEFTSQNLSFPVLSFTYLDTPFRGSGALDNFKAPAVQFSLLSKAIALEAEFSVADKVIKLSKFAGQYFNSPFSIAGNIDIAKPPAAYAGLQGKINLDLRDVKELFKKSARQIEKIDASGTVQAEFNLSGDINDFKSCALTARASGNSLSAYGLKVREFFLDYNQADGLAGIPFLRISLYDGTLKASAEAELYPQDLPFRIEAALENLKLEKLKTDTPAKASDIAGTITAQAKLNGELKDISKLNGSGEIMITDGKLWQLNLFKGLGALVFVKDFGNIVFQQGSCSFAVRDKYISSDSVRLLSNIAELDGGARIGFDGSIESTINVKILDEGVPLTGTFRDITTALLGRAGKFGVIKITGRINDAKYKFQPAVVDIIKSITDTFFKKKK